MKRWRRRAAAPEGPVTWGKAPVPPLTRGGAGTTPGAGEAPPLPAPGHRRGSHMVIDVWECGCIHTWTRATGWHRDYDHIDEEIRRLLTP